MARSAIAAIAAGSLAAACASTARSTIDTVLYDADTFSSAQTYAWAPATPAHLQRAMDGALQTRGFAEASEDADLTFGASLSERSEKSMLDFGDAFFIPGYGPHPGIHVPGAYPRYETRIIRQTDLVVEARHDGDLIWRGVVTSETPNMSNKERTLARASAALLAELPAAH